MNWQDVLLVIAIVFLLGLLVLGILWKHSALTRGEAMAWAKATGLDLARLPGRLRREAADSRTPRRARWWLIGLAIYVVIPIDPIPDFLPGIGQLDDILIVALVLRHVRGMIPEDVWAEHFLSEESDVKTRADQVAS